MKFLRVLVYMAVLSAFLEAQTIKEPQNIVKRMEIETWVEDITATDIHLILHAYVVDVTFENNFGFIYSGGVGIENRHDTSVLDAAFFSTYTLQRDPKKTVSQIKFIAGTIQPTGKGFLSSRKDNSAYLAMARVPMNFYEGKLSIEGELGYKKLLVTDDEDIERLHMGIIVDWALFRPDTRLRYLVYTGAYFEIDTPSVTSEIGLSYVHSKKITYDLLVGTQPEITESLADAEHNEFWSYVGVRITL